MRLALNFQGATMGGQIVRGSESCGWPSISRVLQSGRPSCTESLSCGWPSISRVLQLEYRAYTLRERLRLALNFQGATMKRSRSSSGLRLRLALNFQGATIAGEHVRLRCQLRLALNFQGATILHSGDVSKYLLRLALNFQGATIREPQSPVNTGISWYLG